MTIALSEFAERIRQRQEEHERRMREDPAYRSEQEALEAKEREREAAEERRQAEAQRQALAKHRGEKGIPEFTWRHLDAFRAGSFEAPGPAAEALRWVSRFLANDPPGWLFLLLAGEPGLGKTVAASWYADAPWIGTELGWKGEPRTVTREVNARFVTATELARQSAFDAEWWGALRDAARLVIDDLGVERLDDKGWALSNLVDLLLHRHAHQLPTVITMNIGQQTFEARYAAHDGGRLRDRLAQSAWFVVLKGPSLRRPLLLEEIR